MVVSVHLAVLFLSTSVQSSTLSDLSTLCPYTEYCKKEPQLVTNRERSCCQSCSCSDLCSLVGVCCPDKEPVKYAYTNYPCLTQSVIYHKYLNASFNQYDAGRKFRIVTSCHTPSDVSGSVKSTINEHFSRCSRSRDIDDLAFVTGTESGITFLNKHCAICNGEIDYRKWDLYMTDQYKFERISSHEELERYVFTTGNVVSLPSTAEDLSLAMCYENIISKCNKSGMWNFYNKDFEDKCEQHENIYYHELNAIVEVYKNVFCFLCNMPKNTQVEHECDDLFDIGRYFRTGSASFLALIAFQNNGKSDTKPSGHLCNKTEILDPYQERCLELFCPPGYVPLNGICEPLFHQVSGFTTEVQFDFRLPKDHDNTTEGLKALLKELIKYVKHYVNNNKATCGYCDAAIAVIGDEEYVFQMFFVSSQKCSFLYYLERLNKLFKAPFSVFSKHHNTSVNLVGFSDDANRYNNIRGVIKLQFSFCQKGLFFSDEIVYCPSVYVLEKDIEALAKLKHLKENVLVTSTEFGNETVRLCYSQYKSMFAGSARIFLNNVNYAGMASVIFYFLIM